jgi:hypothetical protein
LIIGFGHDRLMLPTIFLQPHIRQQEYQTRRAVTPGKLRRNQVMPVHHTDAPTIGQPQHEKRQIAPSIPVQLPRNGAFEVHRQRDLID